MAKRWDEYDWLKEVQLIEPKLTESLPVWDNRFKNSDSLKPKSSVPVLIRLQIRAVKNRDD